MAPLAQASRLLAHDDDGAKSTRDPSHGVLDPHDINNAGFFVLFALIGAAFVLTGIWFFFWAKNGGFHFKETDWDDYKSSVLRRRGPNGTLLSGATPSTSLGGAGVYKDVAEDDGKTVVTESTALSGITAGASDVAARDRRKQKQERRDRERHKRRSEREQKRGHSGRHAGEDGPMDEKAEKAAQEELRSYRHEKPARVGGLNKQPEGSQWDGSTKATESATSTSAASDLLSNRQSTPKRTAIRKVYSTADCKSQREAERVRTEARRLRDESRSARRVFSYQRPGGTESAASESLLESGSGNAGDAGGHSSELGTKIYHHPMPDLRERDRDMDREKLREREERRARCGGYRRGGTADEDARE